MYHIADSRRLQQACPTKQFGLATGSEILAQIRQRREAWQSTSSCYTVRFRQYCREVSALALNQANAGCALNTEETLIVNLFDASPERIKPPLSFCLRSFDGPRAAPLHTPLEGCVRFFRPAPETLSGINKSCQESLQLPVYSTLYCLGAAISRGKSDVENAQFVEIILQLKMPRKNKSTIFIRL